MKETMRSVLAPLVLVALLCVTLLAVGGYTPPLSYQWSMLVAAQQAEVIYSADANTTYFAYAEPGSLPTAPVWQVFKRVHAGGTSYPNQDVKIWAGGTNAYTHRVGSTSIKCESILAEDFPQ